MTIFDQPENITGEEIAEYVAIDRSDPDRELARQPQLYGRALEQYETAQVELSRAENELEVAEARAFQRFREDEDLAIGHAREKVPSDPQVQEEKAKVALWERRVGKLNALVKALENRSEMLTCISERY